MNRLTMLKTVGSFSLAGLASLFVGKDHAQAAGICHTACPQCMKPCDTACPTHQVCTRDQNGVLHCENRSNCGLTSRGYVCLC